MGASQSQDSEPNVENKSIKPQNQESNSQSRNKLLSQLGTRVFLNQKRKIHLQKYLVDKKLNKKCFKLFARDLAISWGQDQRYWLWSSRLKETTSDVSIDVAELLKVCWLEVHGKFDVTKLSPETLYEVFVIVMLRDEASGWEAPVTFGLTLPNGQKVERKENLMTMPRGKWIEILVGEFTTSSENVGELEIFFHEIESDEWKSGLLVEGVAVLPKNYGIESGRRL